MKATLTTIIIIIAGFISISATFRKTAANAAPAVEQHHLFSENRGESKDPHFIIVPVITLASDSHATAHHGPEDGKSHYFHFARVKALRRHCNLFCFLAKLILVITHLSLLICSYLSLQMPH